MARKLLEEYGWPGNVRELNNVIERAIILGSDEMLMLEHLPRETRRPPREAGGGSPLNCAPSRGD